jgi:hypothetical protein
VCLFHLISHHIAVDVHCGPDVRVPHHLLLNGNRRTDCIQPSPMRMSEGMRPELIYSSDFCCPLQFSPYSGVGIWLMTEFDGTSEYPIAIRAEARHSLSLACSDTQQEPAAPVADHDQNAYNGEFHFDFSVHGTSPEHPRSGQRNPLTPPSKALVLISLGVIQNLFPQSGQVSRYWRSM